MKTKPTTVPITPAQAKQWRPTGAQAASHRRVRSADSARGEAATAPLPGPLTAAFATAPKDFLGVVLQPLTGTHIAALTQIKSPFVEGIRYGILRLNAGSDRERKKWSARAEAVKNDLTDSLITLYIFSLAPDQVRAALGKGVDFIRAEAAKLTDAMPPFPLDTLGVVLGEHYLASFATAIQFEAAETADGKKTINFPKPAGPTG